VPAHRVWLMAIAFVVVTVVHFALSIASLFITGGLVMSLFDDKGSAFASWAASLTMNILHFPVVNGLSDLMPGLREIGTTLFVANSVIWGIAALCLLAWRSRRAVAMRGGAH